MSGSIKNMCFHQHNINLLSLTLKCLIDQLFNLHNIHDISSINSTKCEILKLPYASKLSEENVIYMNKTKTENFNE